MENAWNKISMNQKGGWKEFPADKDRSAGLYWEKPPVSGVPMETDWSKFPMDQKKGWPEFPAEKDRSARSKVSGLGSLKTLKSFPIWPKQEDKSPSISLPLDDEIKIIRSVRDLNRKKDVVCLILSYPPFNCRNNGNHRDWILDTLKMNRKVRQSLHKEKYVNIQKLSSEITALLHHSIHDIEAHVPPDMVREMCWWWSPRHSQKPMLDLCVDDFVIQQVLQSTGIPEIRRIWISEVYGTTFIRRVKNFPPIRQMFDLVIHVSVQFCKKIEEIESKIMKELGFSKSSREEADKLLRSQNFLILLDHFDPWTDLHDLGKGWWKSGKTQKIAFINIMFDSDVPMDLEIRREDHLLPWKLFCRNVGKVVHSSSIQTVAVHLLKQCSGHFLATVLLARALKDVNDVSIWQHASRVIGFLTTTHTDDGILFNALAFVLERLGSADEYVKYCASYVGKGGMYKVDLLESWMREDLIGTLDEGERIVQQLVNVALLESFENGESIRMLEEVCKELVNFYKAEMNRMPLVELEGRGLVEAPTSEAWEEAHEMYLMNNKISKLPDNPNCPSLSGLFLQGNHHLRVISPSFFQCMPALQILNLSQTKIKSLPQSLCKLVQLRKLILRSCELFTELPVEIGELCNLEVLDLEGTEIINLPASVGKLTNLRNLKVSFYLPTTSNRKNNSSCRIIPQNVISKLFDLEELSIDVNPEDDRWNATVKDILMEVCCLNRLRFLKLHLPEVSLLNDSRNRSLWMKLSWIQFTFTVGNHLKRIISRLPHESAIKFEEQESCLKYVNGVGIATEIKEVLQHATAFFLDHHLTATSLSEFGVETLENLKFCTLQECNKIEAIINANDVDDGAVILPSLEHLNVHYMKNLRSLWEGRPTWNSLFHLKVLSLYSCPQLTTIVTLDLVQTLDNLEELVIEDCPEIKSLLLHPDEPSWRGKSLAKLKKISLHYMPKLGSVFGGEQIAPSLEWLSIYDCPSLKILSPEEVYTCELKVIIGEADWWSALKWNESEWLEPQNLDAIFIPIERDIDLRTQLAVINHQIQAQMEEIESSQQSGYFSESD